MQTAALVLAGNENDAGFQRFFLRRAGDPLNGLVDGPYFLRIRIRREEMAIDHPKVRISADELL